MPQFVQETLATIRRRVGYLVYREKFLYDTILDATASTVTLAKAKRLPDGLLTGNTLYLVDGAGAGTLTSVSTNAQGTGVVTVLPTFGTTPSAGDVVESWPDNVDPEQVNQFINMAILSVQHLSNVLAKATPTIAADRKSVTISASWLKIARLSYKYSDGTKWVMRPRGPLDPIHADNVFDVEDTTLSFEYAIPDDATDVQVVGYRSPAFLESDSDTAEVRSDYLIYKTAELMAASAAEGQTLDPEGHAGQAVGWARLAEAIRPAITMQYLSNTQFVENVV